MRATPPASWRRRARRYAALALALAVTSASTARGDERGDQRVGAILAGIVGIEASVPEGARTAPVLGRERSGSGIVIDGSGLVATIGYLILEATEVEVVVGRSHRVPASIVAYDDTSGLGLVRARAPLGVRPVTLGDSSSLEPRAPLLVVSRGGPGTAQPAVLVSRREYVGYWEYLLDDALYTAPAHPLFGGAALLDGSARLVGIGSLAVSDAMPAPRAMPGNVFVPVEALMRVLPDLLSSGRAAGPPRPWLGVYADDARGPVVIRRIARGGPAARSSLEVGDVVVGVGSRPVTSLAEFYRTLWASGAAGDTITLAVLRGAEIRSVPIRSIDRHQWLALEPVR